MTHSGDVHWVWHVIRRREFSKLNRKLVLFSGSGIYKSISKLKVFLSRKMGRQVGGHGKIALVCSWQSKENCEYI
jgi:hypothetical protein